MDDKNRNDIEQIEETAGIVAVKGFQYLAAEYGKDNVIFAAGLGLVVMFAYLKIIKIMEEK